MLARAESELPTGAGWAYEPKLDGWRVALTVSATRSVTLQSRVGKPLARYFPEIVEAAASSLPLGTVLDGELVIPEGSGVDFAALQARIHPSPTAVEELARARPAAFIAFDVLALDGHDLRGETYDFRRARLVHLLAAKPDYIGLMPMTTNPDLARAWLVDQPKGIEGCVAKRRSGIYRPKVRGWRKIKTTVTTEAVVGGVIGPLERPQALILGLTDERGRLRVAGRTGSLPKPARVELGRLLVPVSGEHPWPETLPASRFGQLPGAPRVAYTQVEPTLVVEIEHDLAYEQDRYRHATRFVRCRPDLSARDLRPLEVPASSGDGAAGVAEE